MPVVWHEPKKRLGNAWNASNRSRMPPKPVWPGLDHNGRPVDNGNGGDGDDDTTSHAAPGTTAVESTCTEATNAAVAAVEIAKTVPVTTNDDDSNHESSTTTAAAAIDTTSTSEIPPLRPRSRKRKKPTPGIWKEIINEGKDDEDEKLPFDLQADDNHNHNHNASLSLSFRNRQSEMEAVETTSPVQIEASSSFCAPPPNSNDVLSYLPAMAKGITHIQIMLGKLGALGASSTTSPTKSTIGAGHSHSHNENQNNNHYHNTHTNNNMEAILARMEAVASRQETAQNQLLHDKEQRIQSLETQVESLESSLQEQQAEATLQQQESLKITQLIETRAQSQQQDYTQRIQALEDEARQRDSVITELQRAQEQERKESQIRVTEALQKLEQLQDQNEKLMRRNAKLKAVKEEYDMLRANNSLRTTNTNSRSLHAASTATTGRSDHQPTQQQQSSSFLLARKNINKDKTTIDKSVKGADRGRGRPMKGNTTKRSRSSSLDGGGYRSTSTSPQPGAAHVVGGFSKIKATASTRSLPPSTHHHQQQQQPGGFDDSSSADSFGTPKRRRSADEGQQSDDSPFSSGSISSTKAVSRPNKQPTSIVPGNTIVSHNQPVGTRPNINKEQQLLLQRKQQQDRDRAASGALYFTKGNRRYPMNKASIRDLIPNYALDSLARGGGRAGTNASHHHHHHHRSSIDPFS